MKIATNLAAVVCIAAIGMNIYAAERPGVSFETTGSISKAPPVPTLKYDSVKNPDGTFEVKLLEDGQAKGPRNRDVLTVFAPNVRTTEKLLHSQDWYMTVDSNGAMRGIYTVPRNNALPSSVLRSLGEGYGIMKVNPQNSFFKVFPSKHQLAAQLTTFTRAAHETVCKQPQKPESLTASMDVKPGWSGAGRITFNATWKITELCKPKSK